MISAFAFPLDAEEPAQICAGSVQAVHLTRLATDGSGKAGTDPNDTLIEGGPGAVRAEFDNVVAMARRPKGFVFHGDEAISAPPMLVKGMLPVSGIAFIGGQSGAGKTFVAVDLAVALAGGSSFFGRKISERVTALCSNSPG
jgi:hypothetical protein